MEPVEWVPMGDGEPFPEVMQGRWFEEGDPTYEVIIRGHELFIRGKPLIYLARCMHAFEDVCEIDVTVPDQRNDGDALCLLHISDGDESFCEMFLYNMHFAFPLVRAEQPSGTRLDDPPGE